MPDCIVCGLHVDPMGPHAESRNGFAHKSCWDSGLPGASNYVGSMFLDATMIHATPGEPPVFENVKVDISPKEPSEFVYFVTCDKCGDKKQCESGIPKGWGIFQLSLQAMAALSDKNVFISVHFCPGCIQAGTKR